MQTNLTTSFKQHASAAVVEKILRKCVHCGFCNATCPTYQLRGDELDGPRGRIYQIKQLFEGAEANLEMRKHLDRCLTCRSCETTCPSGVEYSRLLEVGREVIDESLPRPFAERLKRYAITRFLNSGRLFKLVLGCARLMPGLVPARIQNTMPARQKPLAQVSKQHERRVLMLSGCVQPALAPNTNAAATRLLSRLGISVVEIDTPHCCGAVGLHTSQVEQGKAKASRLIDYWWPHVASGVEAIVVTASGCGVTIKDYATLFENDSAYAQKAKKISELAVDLSELVATEIGDKRISVENSRRIAFHSPCTLQHGQGLKSVVEGLLSAAGYHLCRVADAHLCCGSAGTYSIFQSELSTQLKANKQAALTIDAPDVIATANIGCQMHIANGAEVPVVHWAELLNDVLEEHSFE